MKRLLSMLLVLMTLAAFAPSTGAVTAAPGKGDPGEWTLLASLPIGTGQGQVGYQLDAEGSAPRGPQALSIGPDGTVYVLDSVNRQVHTIRDGQVSTSLPLPFAVYPRDILATDAGLYILDDDNRVLRTSLGGDLEHSYALPQGMATHQVLRLAAGPGKHVVLWATGYNSSLDPGTKSSR